MKVYSTYKESGNNWIGNIPEHWSILKLKRFASVVNGSTPLSSTEEYWDGNIIWVTPADLGSLNGKKVVADSARKITELGLNNCGASITPKGSIILSTRAPIGHLALTDVESCTNQGCKTIVPNISEINNSFLYYYLYVFKEILQSLGQGSTFVELSGQNLKDFPSTFPPLPEQQTIADFLDCKTAQIDALIKKKQRQIDLLQEQRTALINHAVTKGLNPDAPMKDSGVEWLGEIPSHWEVARLRWLAKSVVTGKTPPTIQQEYYENAEINWFSPGDFNHQLVLRESKKKINQLAIDDGQPIYEKGTVLLVGIGATLGKIGILEESGSSNQQINAITYNEKIHPFYGAYYLRTIKEAIMSQANFATLPILNQSQTKDLLHLIPPYEEQTKIVKYVQDKEKQIQKLINVQEKMIEVYQEYRTALISEAVTGKIDVRTVHE